MPELQAAVPLAPPEHTCPQEPQLPTSEVLSTSQPSAVLLLQSKNPVLQAMPHAPEVQAAAAFVRLGQTFPQAPQLLVLVFLLISQPVDALLSQSK